jgi:spore photoproduct lyase
MADTIYFETSIRDHPRCQTILRRMPRARHIEIERYSEVFNPKSQNFRLQKQNPALILSQKHAGFVLPAPIGYNIGGHNNYYFSHMLNCVYDCRYCFLQGMYRSAHQVLFINYEAFVDEIRRISKQHAPEPVWFFSGYDCDSLAYEPVTHFIDYHLPEFNRIENAWLEIRTKSTQIRQLLRHPASERVVVAFSFTDEPTHQQTEHQVPSIQKRIDAMLKLADAGWKLGLRLDPVIYHRHYQQGFEALLKTLFDQLPAEQIHSVSLGSFRMPKQNFKIIHDLYPQEKILNQTFEIQQGMLSYPQQREHEMMAFCESALLQYIPQSAYFPCRW